MEMASSGRESSIGRLQRGGVLVIARSREDLPRLRALVGAITTEPPADMDDLLDRLERLIYEAPVPDDEAWSRSVDRLVETTDPPFFDLALALAALVELLAADGGDDSIELHFAERSVGLLLEAGSVLPKLLFDTSPSSCGKPTPPTARRGPRSSFSTVSCRPISARSTASSIAGSIRPRSRCRPCTSRSWSPSASRRVPAR